MMRWDFKFNWNFRFHQPRQPTNWDTFFDAVMMIAILLFIVWLIV